MADSSLTRTGESPPTLRKGHSVVGPVDQTLYDDGGNAIDGEDIADDASLDTTLQDPDDPDARLSEDRSGDRSERRNPRPGREVGLDVERGDVPAIDRADRDSSV